MRYVFLLNTIILALLAQPVWAKTVYYCTSDTPVTMKDDLVTKHPPERFKMMVDNQRLKLIGGSPSTKVFNFRRELANSEHFHGRMVERLGDGTLLTAGIANFEFQSRILTMTMQSASAGTTDLQINSMIAECDRF
jgi:hypothetical protein